MRSSTGCRSTFLRNVAFCNNTSSEAKVGIVGKIRKVEIYINTGRLSNAQGCACPGGDVALRREQGDNRVHKQYFLQQPVFETVRCLTSLNNNNIM
jgi:hypothetical protein